MYFACNNIAEVAIIDKVENELRLAFLDRFKNSAGVLELLLEVLVLLVHKVGGKADEG